MSRGSPQADTGSWCGVLQLVANSGPGGKDCRAKSVETCSCKGMLRREPAQSSAERVRKTAEMTDDKALDKSVRMGCSVGEHEEVLNRVDELLRDGVVTETREENLGRHAGNDKVETVSTLKSSYESQVSGDRCEVVFTVHEPPDAPPYAYFMYTKKERPK